VKVRRLVSVVVLAALAIGGLSACQTHTGAAAFVGSSRISESEVNRYLSPTAVAYTQQDSNGQPVSVNPKSQVLELLVRQDLFQALFKTLPGGLPSAGALSAGRSTLLSGAGYTNISQLEQTITPHGYRASFAGLILDSNTEATILFSELKDPGDASALLSAVDKLHKPVSINPRYGSWTPTSLAINNGPAVPSFLTLGSTPAAAGGA
jgi:hypothetical protein